MLVQPSVDLTCDLFLRQNLPSSNGLDQPICLRSPSLELPKVDRKFHNDLTFLRVLQKHGVDDEGTKFQHDKVKT